MSELVRYGSYDLEAVEHEEERVADEVTSEFMKLKEGRNVLRFLPPMVGVPSPFTISYEHFIDLPSGKSARFACPQQLAKKACPACEMALKLKRSKSAREKESAWHWKPKRRVYANVIDRGNEEMGVRILVFGKQIHDNLREMRKDHGDYTNPEEDGFDVIITRRGTTKTDTEYSVSPTRGSRPLGNLEWIGAQYDLSSYQEVITYEEIVALLSGEERPRGGGRSGGGGYGGGGGGESRSTHRNAADDAQTVEAEYRVQKDAPTEEEGDDEW